MHALSVTVSRRPGTVVIRPCGEVDFDTAPALVQALENADGAWRDVTVDLSRVGFMDSAGLHALITLHHRALAHHGRLTLSAVCGQPARLFQLVRLEGMFGQDG
ncbi:STAS domain-containing protein [Streptantibioticus cattleyicolor]|uniref:STAS domain-containing protein n=1 Tax=Streptantibioticus cattleyicolor (strain ATCC 35852 / DSM 46488 / JCM 4925 / NBRC 14057 / NRRL 8057) TaxID=1003195 RepID=F8JJX5_STREN|nr:STAS domain-containing protein [Streptantibioticus cattleyicolor]AEW98593.1 hypothetical protein SCATT_p04000 [Streptantibioticus cattleyicolor NRRL 8057 = DSM 46488]CCB72347.1 putative Anti-sigma factor antagonist [Streptantibioticus cattleyicolor NRRL 8057 = DSM 46488]